MKKILFTTALAIFLMGFGGAQQYRTVKNASFRRGETLNYRLHYGFINAGEAVMEISDKIHLVNNRPCYQIDVQGKSTGMFDYILRIRDTWGTYMDTSAMLPHRAYRYIEEGKYRKNETTDFDHFKDSAVVKVFDKKNSNLEKSKKSYRIPENSQDMISGYYYLRTFDYNKMAVGQIIDLSGFFEDTNYNFKVRYLGREVLDTDLGKMKAIILQPMMPENDLFDGEDAIKLWISDDKNKIPLKVQAEMFVGAVEIDITGYKIDGRSFKRP